MRKRPTLVALSAIATLCVASPPRAHDAPKLVPGFLYIATNSPTGNFVIGFSRSQSGALTKRNKTSTGGSGGTGNGAGALDPLGSQNSLILAGPSGPLLVVNAGSDTVASLDIDGERPFLIGAIPSGGTFPSSIATDGNLVYVLNARGTPNITGFRLDSRGALSPIASSTRELPGGSASAPHDVRFTPDGTRLIVTEGGTNQIDVFEVGADGRITNGVTQPSSGSGPFGFAFGRGETLLVTAANSAALASYDAGSDDSLQVTTPALSNGQMAACWASLTRDGRFAFVSNTGSGTLSAYEVSTSGALSLSSAVAAEVSGSAPIDSALSADGAFLYVDDSARGRVLTFAVHGGSLTPMAGATGLPTTIQGIAVE